MEALEAPYSTPVSIDPLRLGNPHQHIQCFARER